MLWAVTGGSQYLGYMTSTVAPEFSIDRVAETVHSIEGRIGTHMSLWVSPWDSVV
jgi:hypothetical protein